MEKDQKQSEKLVIPFKKLREGTIIPKPSKPGDAGSDVRIMGFKRILKTDQEKK